MCTIVKDMQAESKAEGKAEVVRNLLDMGETSYEKIAKIVGESVEFVEEIAKNR